MSQLRLKDLREDKDLKQEDIAKILNISRQYYSRYELGQVELPIRHYITLARYYNVSIDYLCGTTDKIKPFYEGAAIKLQNLTEKQKKLLKAYSDNPKLQIAVDKLLDLDWY